MAGGQLEMLAEDPAAAERELHEAIRLAVEMGASRYAALYQVQIAHVLIAQGRCEDAAGELERASDLYDGVVTWKTAHARVLASRGEIGAAVALAKEAAQEVAGSDDLTTHAETLIELAEVLRASGDGRGAAGALSEAIALHTEKENLVAAARSRERLLELGSEIELGALEGERSN
jgi:predicted Zn-dependent protease